MVTKCWSLIDNGLSVSCTTLSFKDFNLWFVLSRLYLIVSKVKYLSNLLNCKLSLGFFPILSYSCSLLDSERTAHLDEYLGNVTVVWRYFALLSSRFHISEHRSRASCRFFVRLRYLTQASQIGLGKFLKGRALPLNPSIKWLPWQILICPTLIERWLVFWVFSKYSLLRRLFH